MSILEKIGVYKADIDRAWNNLSDSLDRVNLISLSDKIESRLEDEVWKRFCDNPQNPTNIIIQTMFDIGENEILSNMRLKKNAIKTYVNGADSSFEFTEDALKILETAQTCNLNYDFTEWLLEECFLTESEIKEIATDERIMKEVQDCYNEREDLSIYTPEEFNDAQGLIDEKDILTRTCDGRFLCLA